MNKLRSHISKDLGHLLENIVCEIPEKYRIVFTLMELSGLNDYETAVSLDIPRRIVKYRLHRAIVLIHDKLRNLYSPESIFEFNLVFCEGMVKQVMERIRKSGDLPIETI